MYGAQNMVATIGLGWRRYGDQPVGIRLQDRLQHMYVVGQTGSGKSTLLGNLMLEDSRSGLGLCLVDPHGDLASALSARLGVPHLYWNAADPACRLGYNPITYAAEQLRPLIASGLIETLRMQWADSWGPRMEHLLRFAVLALLETPGSDLRDVMRLFVDRGFRRRVTYGLKDAQAAHFWRKEFPAMNYTTAADGVAPIANKLGAFLAHPLVRKAICAPEEPLRFRKIMDKGDVLIVDLAKGRLGADVANVLGGLIVSSIAHAAFSRYDLGEAQRRPFILYVDEFHNFATTAFANLLSEARKYGLGACLAHQFIAQSDHAVHEAIIGNVGSILAFRLGAHDAQRMRIQFPELAITDLMSLPNHHLYGQVMVEGRRSRTFSAITFPPNF